MSTVDGEWKLAIDTPMGVQRFTLHLLRDGDRLTGTATNNNGTSEIADGVVDGDDLTFTAAVQGPFPLTLAFTLTVDGDRLAGTSKAGQFPPSTVSGERA
ncbi:hypothetical protein [Microbacterium sp. GXF7504]